MWDVERLSKTTELNFSQIEIMNRDLKIEVWPSYFKRQTILAPKLSSKIRSYANELND